MWKILVFWAFSEKSNFSGGGDGVFYEKPICQYVGGIAQITHHLFNTQNSTKHGKNSSHYFLCNAWFTRSITFNTYSGTEFPIFNYIYQTVCSTLQV